MDKVEDSRLIFSLKEFEDAKDYWLNQLAGISEGIKIPYDYTKADTYQETVAKYRLEESLSSRFCQVSKNNELALYGLLISNLIILLHKYTQQDEFVITVPVMGEDAKYNKYVFMKAAIQGTMTYKEFLMKTSKDIKDSLNNQHYPSDELVKLLNVKEQSMYSFGFAYDGVHGKSRRAELAELKSDIMLWVSMQNGVVMLEAAYNEAKYKEQTIENFLQAYANIASQTLYQSAIELRKVELVSPEQKLQILEEFNDTACKFDTTKSLIEVLEEKVEETPDNVALLYKDEQITYSEFNNKVNQLARMLSQKGITNNKIVGIMCERSMEMIIGIYAILKAGGAYMPIDPKCPKKRVKYMLEDSDARILLVGKQIFAEEDEIEAEIIELNEQCFTGEDSNLNCKIQPDDLAYIIYTSGSTGKPKGVMLKHAGVSNILQALQMRYPLEQDDAYLLKTTYTFDVSVTEIFGWFFSNGKLAILGEGDEKEPSSIVEAIRKYNVTHINFVPSMLSALLYYLDEESTVTLNKLKYVFVAGEAMPVELTLKFNSKVPNVRLENLYGPTEATIYATGCSLVNFNKDFMTIGKPVENGKAYIVNRENQLMPVGVIGELCLSGIGIAKGYLKDDKLTKEKFIENPFYEGEVLYKTGDLAKWNEDGEIEYLGRIDHQVKIRGYRIELGEIEEVMMQSGHVKEVVVTAFKSSNGTNNLCAYYVPAKTFDKEQMEAFMLERLASYMIPSYYIELQSMPLKSNGKIDRSALPVPTGDIEENSYVKPANIVEEKLCSIMEEVLEVSRFGTANSFFAFGGDSIKAMQVSSLLQKYNVKVKIRDIFEHKTVAELSSFLYEKVENVEKYFEAEGVDISADTDTKLYREANVEDLYKPFALSDVQMAYMVGRSQDFELGNISTHVYVEIESRLDIDRLEDALNKTIERHPMLRTVFLEDGMQKILESVPRYTIQQEDIRGLGEEQEQILSKAREEMSHYIFDVSKWPLLDFKAYRVSDESCYLLVSGDSIISDVASNNIVIGDIMAYYKEPSVVLPDIHFTYRDYILAMQDFRESEEYKEDKKYWIERLEDFPLSPVLPLKLNPSDVEKPLFKRCSATLSVNEWANLKKIAREHGVTPSAILCTAFMNVLSFWSNQAKFAINLTLFNRIPFHKDVNKIVGDFTSTMLLAADFEKADTFWSKVAVVQNELIDMLEHRNYDGVEFVRELSRAHHLQSNKAVMPVVFTSAIFDEEDEQQGGFEQLGDVTYSITQTSQVYLDSQVIKSGEEIWVYWDYVQQLFDEKTIADMFSSYTGALHSILKNKEPEAIVVDKTTEELIQNYNATDEEIPQSLLHELFMKQAKRVGERVAVKMKNTSLTYKQLDETSNQIARYLMNKGVRTHDYVGVLTYREPDTISIIMGILKAGAAYIPVDYEWPEDRQQYVLENSSCKCLLSVKNMNEWNLSEYSTEDIENKNCPKDIAYVIYTSGSTGKPKGVVISHQGAANTILDINQRYDVTEEDRIIGISSMCFDLSVYDIFGALSSGACLVMVEEARDMGALAEIVSDEEITIWNSVPKFMELMLKYTQESENEVDSYWNSNTSQTVEYRNSDSLRLVLLSGDWIPLRLPDMIRDYYSYADVISLGGATEGSIWSIYYPIEEVDKSWKSIPYGMPLANQKMYVLNYQGEFCPLGVEGEICIGGQGVAVEYLNDVEKTEAAFIYHPTLGYIYRTGDYGIMHEEGYIEFLGRKDFQIKIKGHRIEVGEIEACLQNCRNVKDAVVTIHTNEQDEKQLCAFYTTEEMVAKEEIREQLLAKLPPYMIPAFLVELDRIPITSNGKVNRKALMEYRLEECEEEQVMLPTNELEQELADLFMDVLHADKVSINMNLFELGLNSILLMQIRTKIIEKYQIEILFKEFFTANTIQKLAALITKREKKEMNIYPHVEANENIRDEAFPITEVQMAYLVGRNEEFELGGISTHGYVEVETKLDVKRLNQALVKEINYQPMLRAIVLKNGEQRILKQPLDYSIEVVDISHESKEEQDRIIKHERERMSHHVFDTEIWPLFEMKAYKIAEDTHYLMSGFDLIVCDGASMQILMKEVMNFYREPDMVLPERKFTFQDYVCAAKRFEESETFHNDKKYWMEKIDDFPEAPALKLKKHPSKVKTPVFKRHSTIIGWDEWDMIKQKANAHKITPSALLCAVYARVLAFWSNQTRFAINSTVFTRYPFNEDVLDIIGDFTSVQLLDIQLKAGESFWELADNTQKVILEAIEHRHYDGVKFIKELAKKNGNSSKAIMPVVFTSMLFGNQTAVQKEDFSFGEIKMSVSQTPQVYLDYQVSETDQGLMITWDYVEELFDADVIAQMFRQYVDMLTQLVHANDVNQVSISEDDKKLISIYNDTEKALEIKTLQQLFMEQVTLQFDKEAVVLDDESMTYGELHKRSNQIARYLRAQQIGRNDFVGVITHRRIETIANVMGILKAGAAYIPIDPSYPKERIQYIKENSNSKMILELDCYEAFNMDKLENDDLEHINEVSDFAYAIYTSGSTGKPKGVLITHEEAVNTILDINQKFNVGPKDNILGISSMCFDLSVYDIFGALSTGATLVMLNDNKDMEKIVCLLDEKNITIWNSVPAIMDILTDYMEEWSKQDISYWQSEYMKGEVINYVDEYPLRLVMLSGDWIPMTLPEQIKEQFVNAQVISLGGATEGAIWSIYYEIEEQDESWKSIPYGMPLANQQIYILNYEKNLCPIGVAGDIYIGGHGVASGYLNDKEKTEAAFIQHDDFGRIYKTGDNGVMHKEGYIEFLGRKDSQIKIRGYRIELGEIESSLMRCPDVKNAAVVACKNKNQENYLCAYVVLDGKLEPDKIKDYLAQFVPEYMIPTQFIKIDEMPLTDNGKVNRKALPEPDSQAETTVEYVTPENELQEKVLEILQGITGLEKIGIHENILELGLSSSEIISLVTKVHVEFHVKLPFDKVLRYPTIKGIAKCIDDSKTTLEEDKYVTLLNEKTDKNIFLFPPVMSVGIVYMNMMSQLKTHSAYSFDFIEDTDDLVGEYIRKIVEIQPKGMYTLMGHSAGGNIAFKVAMEMERRGYQVSDVILMDSYYVKEDLHTTINFEEDAEYIQMLKDSINELYRDSGDASQADNRELEQKIVHYFEYLRDIKMEGKIKANLHFIASEGDLSLKQKLRVNMDKWGESTEGEFYYHQGYGIHDEMLTKKYANDNMIAIRQILCK